MAYASVTYTSASGTTFALTNSSGDPIEYLRQADIKVFLNGILQTVTTDYTFNTAGTAIVLNTSVSGATVIIQRITDVDTPAVDFTPGSTLVASDLNNATDQTLFGLQELRDEISFGGGVSDGDKGEIFVASSGTLWSIDTGVVTAAKIGTGAVTEIKLGSGSVTETKLGTGAVTAVKIAAAAFTDSVSSTSTTTIATPNSVKTAYDLANAAVPKSGGTMTGDLVVPSLNGGPIGGSRNALINGNPTINQRGYVSGTATSGANQYTLDRWRVVTSGQSITWTDSANVRTVTAPAGGVEQVIEGVNLITGTYTLSWTGTATATVAGNAVTNGATVSITGNVDTTVRFSSGTFSLAQLEPGTRSTPFERRSIGLELALCQRYYEVISYVPVGITYASNGDTRHFTSFTTTKRVAPTMGGFPHSIVVIASTYLGEGINLNGTIDSASSSIFGFQANTMGNSVSIGSAAGGGQVISWGDNGFKTVTASAEL
jgi:hypothetical protein